jgi:hypothetical protein
MLSKWCKRSRRMGGAGVTMNILLRKLKGKEVLFLTVKKWLIEEISIYISDIIYMECCA